MESPAGLKGMLRAFRSRNYRLYFGGQGVSLIGTWMQAIAMSWLVYRLTGSALLLGVVGFASQIPVLILAPFAGVLADRWNRHRMIVVTQTLAMIQAFILALLVLTGRVEVWHILTLSLFLGIVTAFDAPVRHAFVVQMVEKREDLSNAIALNSAMFNGARLVGPSVAGILLAIVGEGVCFLLNGISFLAVIAALLAMSIPPPKLESRTGSMVRGVAEGFSYAYGFVPIRAILLLVSCVSLVAMPYTVLMPVFASEVLHGGPESLGFLMGASGCGALIGAVFLASRKSVFGLWEVIGLAATLFGIGLIAFSLSRVFWLSLLLLMLAGFGMMVQMASSNTLLQTIVEDDKRGRVMSLYTMAFMGIAPFGSLLAGGLAHSLGAPLTLLIGGVACIGAALVFASQLPMLREMVHPIYVKMGLLSE